MKGKRESLAPVVYLPKKDAPEIRTKQVNTEHMMHKSVASTMTGNDLTKKINKGTNTDLVKENVVKN